MNCPICSTHNADSAGFCKGCGLSLNVAQTGEQQNYAPPPSVPNAAPRISPYQQPMMFPPNNNAPPAPPYYPPGQHAGFGYNANFVTGDVSKVRYAVIALILGIFSTLSLLFALLFYYDYAALIVFIAGDIAGIAGIVLSAIGLSSTRKGMAVTAMVFSIIGTIISALFTLALASIVI
jgi:hypothetical protein